LGVFCFGWFFGPNDHSHFVSVKGLNLFHWMIRSSEGLWTLYQSGPTQKKL
jgi:hypothetical protein